MCDTGIILIKYEQVLKKNDQGFIIHNIKCLVSFTIFLYIYSYNIEYGL